MPIKQIELANTFGEWVTATQATITQWNTLEPNINLVFYYANSTVNVYTDTVNVYSNTVNVYSNTVTLHSNVVNNHTNVVIKYGETLNVYSNTVTVYNSINAFVQVAYDTANTVEIIANTANNTANLAFATATNSYTHANSAHDKANTAYIHANSAHDKANTAYIHANSAHDKANTAYIHANSAYTTANDAHRHANSAYDKANTTYIHANSAYDTVNTLLALANTANLAVITNTTSDSNQYNIVLTANSSGLLTNVKVSNTRITFQPSTGTIRSNIANTDIININGTVLVDSNRNISNVKAITETVFTISDASNVDINPANGTIQVWTLGANRTPYANSFSNGQAITLMVADGTANTITWSTINVQWVGAAAPALATSGYTVIELWKANNWVYGARVGDVAI
uniref:Tail protein n=1 Tax=viral metagenome TaxID=1070528 RepID=A0A6C0JTS6_9ZZZZ